MDNQYFINLEKKYGARDYNPLPVVLSKGKGVFFGMLMKKYYDFLSAYSAVNQGHCHPKIIKVLKDQPLNLLLHQEPFNDKLGQYMEFATKLFDYEKLLR